MSTTEYKIKVMQASLEGEQIQKKKQIAMINNHYNDDMTPIWDWDLYDYMVKQKSTFVNRLFKNAPIMQMNLDTRSDNNPEWKLEKFKYENEKEAYRDQGIYEKGEIEGFWNYIRLPTAEEAPRNVWLVPWDEEPKDLPEKDYLLNYGNNIISQCHIGYKIKDWDDIKAIMLLEAF